MSETVFNKVDYSLQSLLNFIELGQIALPDIQRPFVWTNAKVRDLFDSLYRGYPVGYLLLWQSSSVEGTRQIGTAEKQVSPSLLIVDGQQRLTALFAVIKGVSVVREDYSREKIEISFSPIAGTFEVADAATRKDPRYIADISTVWNTSANIFEIAAKYIERLTKARMANGETLGAAEVTKVQAAIHRLSNLTQFPFTALVLLPTIDEEQVSEVFVRINSQGKSLNQSDFILTLMSVFWDEGRTALEDFSKQSRVFSKTETTPHNAFIEPLPDQLLRVAVGVGFRRARLRHVYSLLRGKDLETGEFSDDRRDQQFAILKEAQAKVLSLQNWSDFLGILPTAGYKSGSYISSENNILLSYILFLIGRYDYKVDKHVLKGLIAQWFFMTSLTARYTGGSPESIMERDLVSLRDLKTADEFVNWVRGNIDVELTSDFWTITLPNRLRSSAARSPALFAYYASLVLIDAPVLFSNKKVADVLGVAQRQNKGPVERHHLFPRNYLKTAFALTSVQDVNRIANLAIVEWDDNIAIADTPPADYAPKYASRFPGARLAEMYHAHGLPADWYELPYQQFVAQREKLLAKVIKDGFNKLVEKPDKSGHALTSIEKMIAAGEGPKIEYKATLRTNLHTKSPDPKIEHSVLKTIAGFMNSEGGTLLIGVEDSGKVCGVAADAFQTEDKMLLHFTNIAGDRLGNSNVMYLDTHFESVGDARVLVVSVRPAAKAVFVKEDAASRFYVRTIASTTELRGSDAQHYISERF